MNRKLEPNRTESNRYHTVYTQICLRHTTYDLLSKLPPLLPANHFKNTCHPLQKTPGTCCQKTPGTVAEITAEDCCKKHQSQDGCQLCSNLFEVVAKPTLNPNSTQIWISTMKLAFVRFIKHVLSWHSYTCTPHCHFRSPPLSALVGIVVHIFGQQELSADVGSISGWHCNWMQLDGAWWCTGITYKR